MKKTYILPSTKAIKIQISNLIMTSVPVDPNTETDTQLSREFFGDDDWNDE
jgi:hypothetical protein